MTMPTDEQIATGNRIKEFIRDAGPDEWLEYASDLRDAAEALWQHRGQTMHIGAHDQLEGGQKLERSNGHERSYILLAGLALENALKGLIIARDPTLITSGKLDRTLHNHKLTVLAGKIPDIVFSPDDRDTMKICESAIPYWGRYPIPLKYEGLEPTVAASPEFRERFIALHFRICRALYYMIRDGWETGFGPGVLMCRILEYEDDPVAARKQISDFRLPESKPRPMTKEEIAFLCSLPQHK